MFSDFRHTECLQPFLGARLQFGNKGLSSAALCGNGISQNITQRNKRQSRAGGRELHSRGSGEVMTALLAGEVSSLVRLGSCLWLMESRDCLGISLAHLNISMCYKCSQKMKCRSSLGSPGIRSLGFLKCRDGSRQICEPLNLDPFGLFLECLVERKCHFCK